MNYIGLLQNQKIELERQMREARQEILEFRKFLESPKFAGTESDGSRKDWIATGDVNRLLISIDEKLTGV